MRRVSRRVLLTVLGPSCLAACDFSPVYGPAAPGQDSSAALALGRISVGIIPERSGQLLRLALQERFERAGVTTARQYDLSVAFSIISDAVGFRSDSTTTFIRLIGTATYSLISQDPARATLTSGTARSVDGYNLFATQFFAWDMETDAVQRRLAQAVADQIASQLASYFAKRAAVSLG